jgi:iron(III) transport system ATP-binding protein
MLAPTPAAAAEPAIRLSGLVKRFGDVTAVHNVDLAAPKGAFLVLVGPSGCGKSTMLRMLAGLDAPSEGEIAFVGKVVSSGAGGVVARAADRDAGLVFQSYALWPHMTVAGNIDWPLKVAGWPAGRRRERIAEVAKLLGIDALVERYPNEISGGQQQRVAIARMIAPQPAILLFDEPLSNLDAKLRVDMRAELLRIHRATGATTVYVTHDQVEAMTMATHVAVMNHGRVEQFGPPADLLRAPATAFVATFLGTPPGNLIAASLEDGVYRHAGVTLADVSVGQGAPDAQLLYRAEDIALGAIPGHPTLAATVEEAAPMAGRMMMTARVGDIRLTAIVDASEAPRHGAPITLSLPAAPAAVYGPDGAKIETARTAA